MGSVQMIERRIQEPKNDKQPEAGVFIPVVDIIQHAWYHVFLSDPSPIFGYACQ